MIAIMLTNDTDSKNEKETIRVLLRNPKKK